ncbi:MAG: 30S ribosomal protein THX [Leeuwenhoekiella sp.]
MGKGDQKTRRGKIHRGTYGKRRRRNKPSTTVADVPTKQNSTKTLDSKEEKSKENKGLVEE